MYLLIIGAIFTALLMTSCGSDSSTNPDDNDNNYNNSSDYYITAKIEGVAWAAENSSIVCMINSINGFVLQGKLANGKDQISINTMGFKKENFTGQPVELELNSSNATNYAAYKNGDDETFLTMHFQKASGKLTITKLTDDYVEGTFEFKAINTTDGVSEININDGKFHLQYIDGFTGSIK